MSCDRPSDMGYVKMCVSNVETILMCRLPLPPKKWQYYLLIQEEHVGKLNMEIFKIIIK